MSSDDALPPGAAMADFSDHITDAHRTFIAEQPMFFVATAPRSGRINLSPKGMDTLRVLGANRVAYLDLTGSGNETAAHLQDDPRITVMLSSFGPKPLILRLYGAGAVVRPDDPGWPGLQRHFPDLPGTRQIMDIAVDSVQTSCGYAVPRMDLLGERETLRRWAEHQGDDGLDEYRAARNAVSIDGQPVPIP